MKKFLKITCIFTICLSLIILAGCNSADKTLAKNLDNTVTNLVYAITNLDFADNSDLDMLNEKQNETDTYNINPSDDKNANCCENCENLDTYQQKFNNCQNYKLNENMSGYPGFNKEFSDRPFSKAKYNNYQYSNTAKTNSPISTYSLNNETQKNETKQLVSFSTGQISENNNTLKNLITALINKRSTLLLYINDLYKGNVSILSSNRNSINAYMNILKDNTSYFNQHRGLITNQIEQAKELYNSDNSSSLINAYIIRTNEAISTRIAKLESSISALDSILEIMKGSQNSNSKSYVLNNYNNTPIQKEANNEYQINNPIAENSNINNYQIISSDQNEYQNLRYSGNTIENNQGLDTANINNENNIKDTLRHNNILLPPRKNYEYGQELYAPYCQNQSCNKPYQYIDKNPNQENQPNNNYFNTNSNCENCEKQTIQNQEIKNIETTNKNRNEKPIITENENLNIISESQKETINKNISQNKETHASKIHFADDENQKEINIKNEVLAEEQKKNQIDKLNKKQDKKENILNEKIREEQSEIIKNKQLQESKTKTQNKISNFFIEDKTNRDRRLKTINNSTSKQETINKFYNIEKANFVQK